MNKLQLTGVVLAVSAAALISVSSAFATGVEDQKRPHQQQDGSMGQNGQNDGRRDNDHRDNGPRGNGPRDNDHRDNGPRDNIN